MRVDLFEVLDGLFKGIIFFFYNLIESVLLSIRHPITSPSLLFRRHKAKDRLQVSSQTLLLSGYLGVHALVMLVLFREGPFQASMSEILGATELRAWGPVFLASLASTVALDSLLRLAIRQRYMGRARREAALAQTEYALFAPAVLISGGTWIFAVNWHGGGVLFPEERWFTPALGLILFALACFATLPATKQFWRRRVQPSPPADEAAADVAKRPVFLEGLMKVARSLALGLAAVFASMFGALVVDRAMERPETGIAISGLRCHVSNERPFIDAMLTNGMPHAVALDLSEYELFVGRLTPRESGGWSRGEGERWRVQPREGPDAPPILVVPGETVLVRADVRAPPRPPSPSLPSGMSYTGYSECLLQRSAGSRVRDRFDGISGRLE